VVRRQTRSCVFSREGTPAKQEDHSLKLARSYLKNKPDMMMHTLIPATREAEVGGAQLRPTQAKFAGYPI
jgi:hypothetical protein